MTTELVRATDQRRCALYRHYDENDVLLYVGITDTLADRTNNGHARTSEWVQFAVRAEAEWLDSRDEASTAERAAVKDERPIFNRQYAEWDPDRRIAAYLHHREVAELKATIAEFKHAAGQLFAALPREDYQAAEASAAHDYECADLQVDDTFHASVLRHVARLIRDRTTDARDEASADALLLVAKFVHQQIEAIRDRREAAMEPPF